MQAAWSIFPTRFFLLSGRFLKPRFFVYLGGLKEKSEKILLCLIVSGGGILCLLA
jgi:hypothetical protein